jgi:uncharacterized protein YjbJ (UPF0337 family)
VAQAGKDCLTNPSEGETTMPDFDKVEGELKEKEGEITGDEIREKQGEGQQAWGEAKDKAEDVKDEIDERT